MVPIPWIIQAIGALYVWSGLFYLYPSWLQYWHWQIYANHILNEISHSPHCTIYSHRRMQTSDIHLFDSFYWQKIWEVVRTNHDGSIQQNITASFYYCQPNVIYPQHVELGVINIKYMHKLNHDHWVNSNGYIRDFFFISMHDINRRYRWIDFLPSY